MTKKEGLPLTAPEDPIKDIIVQTPVWDSFLENAPDVELAGPLVKEMVNVFVAQSGSGKSLLAFLVSWNELFKQNFSRVFYIDLDNPHNIWKDRYSSFHKQQELLYFTEYILLHIDSLAGSMPVEKAWSLLQALAKSEYTRESLVVIDSLQNVVDYNDRRELTKLFDVCRAITFQGGTVLIIHHKSSKMESPAFKGLSLIKDFADIMWEVTPDRKKNGEIDSFKLTCVKNRSTTSFTNFVIGFNTDTGYVSYDQNILFEDELPTKEAILTVLKKTDGLKQSDLVQAVKPNVKLGEKRIRSVLAKLVALGLISVKTVKTAKVYSLNTKNIEPGYLDALEEEFTEADMPF